MDDKVLQKSVLKDYGETVVTANSSTSYTIDLTEGNVFDITLTGNCAFTFANPPASGVAGSFTLYLTQDGTGGRTVTWPTAVKWPSGSEPTILTEADDLNLFSFFTIDGGATWYGSNLNPDLLTGTNGNDSYTKLLLHMAGADASTTFIDSSPSSKSISVAGNTQVDTAQSKFGGTSAYFDGTGDLLEFANDLALDSSDFTIDWWQRQNTRTSSQYDGAFIYDDNATNSMYITIGAGASGHSFLVRNSGNTGWAVQISLGSLPSLDTWHHYAVVRNSNTWTVYINGSSAGSASYSGSINSATGNFNIGWGGTSDSYFDGRIDEFRISKGIARWTTAFTPPTESYY